MKLTNLKVLYCFVIALIAILSGCKNVAVTDESRSAYQKTIVQAENDFTYTTQQLFKALDRSHLVPTGGEVSSDEVFSFLDSLLCDTLATLEATHIDLGYYPEQRSIYRLRYYDFLLRAYMRQVIYAHLETDSNEVVDYFNSHPETFASLERVHISHILASPVTIREGADSLRTRALSFEALTDEAEDHIQKAYRELESGRDFNEVAVELSHDVVVTRDRGDIGWIDRGVFEDPFDSLAFSMTAGTFSTPFKDRNGWHIIYKADYAEAGLPELTPELFQKAGEQLQGEKTDSIARPLLDSLEQAINLDINEQLLDTNYYKVDEWEWVAILNGIDTLSVHDVIAMEEPLRNKNHVDNTTVDLKRLMIREAARKMILIEAARAAHIDTLQYVSAEQESIYAKYSKAVVMRERSDPTWYPTDEQIQLHFDRFYKQKRVEKPFKIQHIVCEDSVLARFVADQAQSGVDFLELAEKFYSGEEALRRRMADLGNVSSNDVTAEIFSAAKTTPAGQVSEPIKTEYGWEIIKVLTRREKRSLSRYRSQIVTELRAEHSKETFEAFRDRLYRKYHLRFTSTIPAVILKAGKDRTR